MAAEEPVLEKNGTNGEKIEVLDIKVESNTVEDSSGVKLNAADRRRRRRKEKKKKGKSNSVKEEIIEIKKEPTDDEPDGSVENVEVEYVIEKPEIAAEGYEELLKVFEKFAATDDSKKEEEAAEEEKSKKDKKDDSDNSDSDEDDDKNQDKKLSNKERKVKNRMKVAELKQIAPKPDVVEVWDVTATDPKTLVFLKSIRNSVPVPRHWSQKRKYLQGKRGIEKIPFQLPDFIAATGIQKLRQAYVEKEDAKKMKQKQRDKMQPKMGKMDIDYQVLHDAFFKFQTKPKLTLLGDVYYEGKEFESKSHEYKPGQPSASLKNALGMTDISSPPPWLVNMQRYGPPPSYPHLRIPGLNAPIPHGASFGYHSGGWGKPPVDEFGRPIYGDVFGTIQQTEDFYEAEMVDKSHWGDLEEIEEEEEEEEEEEADEAGDDGDQVGDQEIEAGIQSVETISSTPTGVETPEVIDLRKGQKTEKSLYTVLDEQEERITAGTIMGSSHTYVVPGVAPPGKKVVELLKSQKGEKVDVTLRPEELDELDDSAIAQKYEQARQEDVPSREDFSDLVAQREANRKRKAQDKDGKSKKQKEFKF